MSAASNLDSTLAANAVRLHEKKAAVTRERARVVRYLRALAVESAEWLEHEEASALTGAARDIEQGRHT